ncbi:MAG TPA: hypothetical protein VM013_04740 [Dehalococcoidia bacterium]|nr:hypothetical protein [Dehalococcoidia bacterium]
MTEAKPVVNLPMEASTPLRHEEEMDAPLWLMTTFFVSLLATAAALVAPALDNEAGWSL